MTKADVNKIDDLSQKLINTLKDCGMNKAVDKLENVLYDILEQAEVKAMKD